MTRTKTGPLALAVAGLFLAGCGTTVPLASPEAATGTQGSSLQQSAGLQAPTQLRSKGGATASGVLPSVAGQSQTGAAVSGGTSSKSSAALVPSNSPHRVPNHVVATLAPVDVGFEYADPTETAAFAANVGIKGAYVGNQKADAQAVVDYVNAHGGFAGHKVNPVFYDFKISRTDQDVEFQEMCTTWTQDHHVVAGFVWLMADVRQLAECMGQHHAIFDNLAEYARSNSDYALSSTWIDHSMLSVDRIAPSFVQTIQQMGYFGQHPRIGLLENDSPESQHLAQLITGLLQHLGLSVAATDSMSTDIKNMPAQAQSAVLKFHSAQVDHVISTAYPFGAMFFMQGAQPQHYNPRYALTSADGLGVTASSVPAQQLTDAVGIGWWRYLDLPTSQTQPQNEMAKTCLAIFEHAGIADSQKPFSLPYCDFTFMLKEAAALITPTAQLSGDALTVAVEHLGSHFVPSFNFATRITASHHDGIDAARPVRFDSSCGCFQYAGPLVTPGG